MGTLILWVRLIDGKPDLPADVPALEHSTIAPDVDYCAVEIDDRLWKQVEFVGKYYDAKTKPYDLIPPPAAELSATLDARAEIDSKLNAYTAVCARADARRKDQVVGRTGSL